MKQRAPRQPRLKHPVDISLGARIKFARTRQDPPIAQQWLGTDIGCSAQQIQKYESGQNPVRFSTLCEIAKALGIRVRDLIDPVLLETGFL